MSKINSDISQINTPPFYLTKPQPCPYLENRTERKIFTILQGGNADSLNNLLSGCGFRRSQNIAYRPACDGCNACLTTRIPVKNFKPSKSQKRISKKNTDILGWNLDCEASSEQYDLFESYVQKRHLDGGMANMGILDYAMMIEETHVQSIVREYRLKETKNSSESALKAVALCDILSDGLSMVYSFYDVNAASRSLGVYMILDHIAQAQRLELDYVYLGYWVKNSPKMAYKSQFKGIEVLTNNGWELIENLE